MVIFMQNIKGGLKSLHSLFTSRLFGIVVLSVMSAAAVGIVSVNTRTVTVHDGGKTVTVMTMRKTTDGVLAQLGISVTPSDVVESVDRGRHNTVTVKRSFDVSVIADGQTTNLKVIGGTVSEALRMSDISLETDDTMNCALSDDLTYNMTIVIDRVDFKTFDKSEKIAYKTVKEETSTLKKGTTQIKVAGVAGERVTVFKQTIVNGQVTNTEQINQYTAKYAVDEKILVGTATSVPVAGNTVAAQANVSADIVLDANGQPIKYTKFYEGKATAYSASPGAGTASGRKAMVGHVAVDPKLIPYGTKLYIVSADGKYTYGYAIAADTGGALRSGAVLVDVFFNTNAECYKFGAKTLRVYILE